jgi:hypothetical protein
MPRACPVEAHARGYCRHSFFPRCHGLVPWRLTLVATAATAFFLDATGLSRGGSRWWLLPPQLFSSMPRACPVEAHARGSSSGDREAPRDEPVASGREAAVGSGQREPPRHKAVASGWLIWSPMELLNPRIRRTILLKNTTDLVTDGVAQSLYLEPFRNGVHRGRLSLLRERLLTEG